MWRKGIVLLAALAILLGCGSSETSEPSAASAGNGGGSTAGTGGSGVGGTSGSSGGSGGASTGGAAGVAGTGGTVRDTAHFDIPPDGFPGSVDFVHGIVQASATGQQHTIIVERYHGSTGAVSVDFQSAGAPHTQLSGTLTWADGERGRKSFTLDIPTHTLAGEERVTIDLVNPQGGVRLGRGGYTRAYIVTDDGSENPDAIWADGNQGDDQVNNGSKGSPVQTVSRAIELAEQQPADFIYLVGTFPVSREPIVNDLGHQAHGIYLPTRSVESERLVIRVAPWTHGDSRRCRQFRL